MRFIFLLFCLTAGGWGGNHALLIGVGKYQIPNFDGPGGEAPTALPGIDRDLALMRETVARLGYKPEDVTVLSNERASLEAVRREMGRLAERAGRNDRVLIYYSGHGAQVPDRAPLDEQDWEHEAIVPWDFRPGRETLENVLVDDEMATLLGRIQAENLLVIFDSCHIGTADRRMVLGTAKSGVGPAWRNKRLPTQWNVKSTQGGAEGAGMAEVSHLALMAAREDETASATSQGSILTLAVHAAVEQATRQHSAVSATELHAVEEAVAERFAENLAKQGETVSQHPQLRGPEEKRSLNLQQVDDAFAMMSEWAESVPGKPPSLADGNDRELVEQVVPGMIAP